jgi:hypothetical protein
VRVLFSYLVLAMSVAGCVQQPMAVASSAVVGNCPDWGCPSNAASMGDRLVFHEVDSCRQEANAAGIRMVGFDLGGTDMMLQVLGDEMFAIDTSTTARYSGDQLVGGILKLHSTTTGEYFDVAITDRGETDFWVDPSRTVPTYTFKYRLGQRPPRYPELGDREGFAALCAGKHLDPESQQTMPDEQLALVFGRDRYDARAKTVALTGGECWINIACAGSAVAKMHLLRHTEAGSDANHITDVGQRQAMLKTITDDICGTGRSFTQDGEDVYYQDIRAWHPLPSVLGKLEAVWDQNGAVCLDEPRRAREDPDIRARISSECSRRCPAGRCPRGPPPSCSAMGIDVSTWTSSRGAPYAISVNPP